MPKREHLTDLDLVRLTDRELSDRRTAAFLAHIAACDDCRARLDTVALAVTEAVATVRSERGASTDTQTRARAALETRLAQAPSWNRSRIGAGKAFSSSVGRWSTAAAAVVAVLLAARAVRSHPPPQPTHSPVFVERDALPIAALTPGATADVTVDQICRGDVPRTAADPIVRDRVVAEYGMAHVPQHDYELDYLITPELGGAADPQNLWPERYGDRVWNAKVKDQLEDLLPALVCEGKVDLRTAQQDIAANWVAAYKKYFKTDVPLRPGA